MMMKWLAFYIIYRRNFPSIRGGHREDLFTLLSAFATLLFALALCGNTALNSCMSFFWKIWRAMENPGGSENFGGKLRRPTKFRRMSKILAENFCVSQNLGGWEKFLRKICAPHKI
jgi:hypothetical protein